MWWLCDGILKRGKYTRFTWFLSDSNFGKKKNSFLLKFSGGIVRFKTDVQWKWNDRRFNLYRFDTDFFFVFSFEYLHKHFTLLEPLHMFIYLLLFLCFWFFLFLVFFCLSVKFSAVVVVVRHRHLIHYHFFCSLFTGFEFKAKMICLLAWFGLICCYLTFL